MKPFDYYEIEDASEEQITAMLSRLPRIAVKARWRDQLSLQIRMTPWYFYGGFLLFTIGCAVQISTLDFTNEIENLMLYLGVYVMLITLLMLPELMRSSVYQCEELERSCKFSYLQILFTRMVLFVTTLMLSGALFALSASSRYELSFFKIYLFMLTFIVCALLISEALYLLIRGRDHRLLMILYAAVSLGLLEIGIPIVKHLSVVSDLCLLLVLCVLLSFLSKKLWKEVVSNETFRIEAD